MVEMMSFAHNAPQDPVLNVETVPKEFDIFFKSEDQFLPEGKDFKDLTPEEEQRLRSQYRFSPLRPGEYQSITGMTGGRNGGM